MTDPSEKIAPRLGPPLFNVAALSLILATAAFAAVAFVVFPQLNRSIGVEDYLSQLRVPNIAEFQPEPGERALFFLGLVFFPPCLFALMSGFQRAAGRFAGRTITPLLDLTFTVFLGVYLWHLVSASAVYLAFTPIARHPILGSAYFLSSIGIIWFMNRSRTVTGLLAIATLMPLGGLLLYAYVDSGAWYAGYVHFQGVFYAMVQVHHGRTILADFTTAYGLYPHFLDPIFRLIGLSASSFSLVLAGMTATLFALLWFSLRSYLKNQTLAAFSWFTLFFLGYPNFLMWTDARDAYFQYWPIRILAPFVLIAFAPGYFVKPGKLKYFVALIGLSLAALWNLDTGLVAFIAWVLVLVYSEFLGLPPRTATIRATRHVFTSLAVLASVLGTYWIYHRLVSGVSVDFSSAFRYQKIFYATGFYALPMPAFGTWTFVIGVYLSGLTYAVGILLRSPAERADRSEERARLILLLSLLGIGLFAYYQNRSHERVLTNCWYPAVIVLATFADLLLENFRNRRNGVTQNALLFVCLAILLPGPWNVAESLATYDTKIYDQFERIFHPRTTPLAEGIELIRRHSSPGERITLFSLRAAEFYLYSETSFECFPDFVDTFLASDFEKLARCLAIPGPRKVFIDQGWVEGFTRTPQGAALYEYVLNNYPFVERSTAGMVSAYFKVL